VGFEQIIDVLIPVAQLHGWTLADVGSQDVQPSSPPDQAVPYVCFAG
jgi:hypothetical protein